MSECEPIVLRPRAGGHAGHGPVSAGREPLTVFDRHELREIFRVYGRKVAAGEWRDYALDMGAETAVFSVFRRSCEYPLFRIEKAPRLARKQGAYSVVAATGLILKRGHDLSRVLGVLDKSLRSVE